MREFIKYVILSLVAAIIVFIGVGILAILVPSQQDINSMAKFILENR